MSYGNAGQYGPQAVLFDLGSGVPSLLRSTAITVKTSGGATATLFTDRTATTAASNPVSTDASGNLSFFAAPGAYTLNYTTLAGAVSLPITVQLDPADKTPDVFAQGAYAPTQGTKFVASTGVAATDTANLQAAHDAFTSAGGTIRLDAGPYALNGVNFTKPIHLIGSGPNGASVGSTSSYLTTGSVINCPSSTAVCIQVNADGCTFEKLAIFNTGTTPTAGAGIQVATAGHTTRLVDCSISGFWINLDIINGYEWFVDRCHFFDPVTAAISVQDQTVPDGGDGIISNCFIYAGPNNLTPGDGILWKSGGGLKVLGTKINGRGSGRFTVGIDYKVADGISTSVGIVSGCSIENVSYGILTQLSGAANTGLFSKLAFTGNEILASLYGIALAPSVAGKIKNIVASGNVGSGGTAFLLVGNVADADLVTNKPLAGGTATSFSGTPSNIYIDGFAYTTAARPSASVMRPGAKYFDTTLGKPVWSDGTTWRDASGTAV